MTTTARTDELSAAWAALCGDAPYGSLIDGEIVAGEGADVAVEDPVSGALLYRYPEAGAGLAKAAAAAAAQAQERWYRAMTAAERGRTLWRAAQAVRERVEPLALLESLSASKPLRDTRVEATKVAEMFEYYAGWCDKLHGDVIPVPSSHLNYTLRVPHGVVAQVTPWNAPIFTGGWQLAPALAAGNAVVLKPSELTPLSSVALGRILNDAGVPAGAVNVLAGYGGTTGAAMFAAKPVQFAVFVGSPATGRIVARIAAERLIPSLLELGGKSANIVFADADIDKAIGGAAAAIYAAAGQSCVAGSRLLIQEQAYDGVVEGLAAKAASLRLGDPCDSETQVGPINNRAQVERVEAMVERAREAGARVVCGGARRAVGGANDGFFFAPTVIADVTNDMEIAREEVFGPVVAAIPFKDETDALAIANDSDFGLAGAVWSKDVERAHRVAARIEAGTIWINGYKTIGVMSPFGGFKESGYGRSSGWEAMLEYTRTKSIWTETADAPKMAFGY